MSRLAVRRATQLILGLVAYGAGVGLMVIAAVGVSPWDVLAQGVARVTTLDFGLATILISGVVLLLWIPLRQRLGIGTLANAVMVGAVAQLVLWFVPAPEEIWIRALVFAGGLAMVAVATGLYIGAELGPGPRDGLMTGIVARTGWPVWVVRTGIEITVVAIGWALGGNVGIGTIAFALLIGPMVHVTMPWFSLRARIAAARVAKAEEVVP
ncbi:MAG TPA: hypothetical protein VNR37_08975 [Microbacteriaceae bacterium]|nr:hypothetical protein [Microbacteriaceae bacterium]